MPPPGDVPLRVPAAVRGPERAPLTISVDSRYRVYALGLPPGARFERDQLTWTPDFVQGGRRWTVTFVAVDGDRSWSAETVITIEDTVHPPDPEIVDRRELPEHVLLDVLQATDQFLGPPGHAGLRFAARVVVPKDQSRRHPVQLDLHGFRGRPEPRPQRGQFSIHPSDPFNTYWWGYASSLPERTPSGTVPNYTQRRALHLVDWVLRSFTAADPERVYVFGESMGGTGALALGLLSARHFAAVESRVGQVVARNHRPRRIAQLSRLWGSPQVNLPDDDPTAPLGVWDRLDLVRAMTARPEAKHQFVFTRHGKDDSVIHFGAVVHPSPELGLSFYDALQALRIGHYVVWDEGGHVAPDPVLDDGWWDDGWDRITDRETYLRRDLAFPAFSGSDADDDYGNGGGNGSRPWHEDRGFAGDRSVPQDTGWTGDVAGAVNRYLRWDSRSIVDRWHRFEIRLRVHAGPGGPPPRAGYPPVGDRIEVPLPITVDVTPRRTQAFVCRPGELIRWRFGAQGGAAVANADGTVTIPRLAITTQYQRLVLTRISID